MSGHKGKTDLGGGGGASGQTKSAKGTGGGKLSEGIPDNQGVGNAHTSSRTAEGKKNPGGAASARGDLGGGDAGNAETITGDPDSLMG